MDFNKECQPIPIFSTSLYKIYQHNKDERIIPTTAQYMCSF